LPATSLKLGMPRPASTSVIPEGHLTIVRRLQRRDPLRAAQVPTPEERLIRWPVTGQPSLRGILGVEGRVAQIEDSFRNFEYFGAVWIKGSHMMGQQNQQKELFGYSIDLDRRVRPDNPLRKIGARIDFSFARAEVEHTYGHNGNVSVDPVVILKMMFLLFLDNIASERELMQIIPERLDYLWFLGYGLNDQVPNHSVLSKARTRWGTQVFEQLFLRTVGECVAAGLVEGKKIHLDGSLIAANASNHLIAACQNTRILLGKNLRQPSAALAMVLEDFLDLSNRVYSGNLPPIDQRTSSDAIWN
jgi:transposase